MWNDLAGRMRASWSAQSSQFRMFALAGVGVFAIALAAISWTYLKPPSYETLFSNLSADDAARVTQRLKDDKIPYRLSDDGQTVYVPSKDLSDERVAIAGSNIIKGGGTGYELFDRTNFGMTEFEEKLDKTRAIEGELQRTIDGLDPVDAARVNIAVPDGSLYTSTQSPTTASVAIRTKPGETLSPQEVRGITMLVANAVENLKPENVTIVDQAGDVLLPAAGSGDAADPTGGDALKLTQEQLLAKQRYETNLQQNIQSMLDETLGARRAVARVSTKMDFDANSSESKTYSPAGTVLSSQNKRETYNGTQAALPAAIGVPGSTSNIGTYQAPASRGARGNYNKNENTTNYDISEQNVKHVDAPGKVLQTSVAVLVNAGSAAAPGAPAPAPAASAAYTLTSANIAQIRNAVIAAAGLNLTQGDQISVEAVPFNPSVANEAIAPPVGGVFGLPGWAGITLAVLALLGVLGFLGARARRGSWRPSADLPSFDSSLAEELPPFEEHPMLDGAPGIAAPIRSAADLTREQMIEYVTTVTKESPDNIAKLVKLWLAE
jgi:flagellar M-ring protein FliF